MQKVDFSLINKPDLDPPPQTNLAWTERGMLKNHVPPNLDISKVRS